MAEDSILLEKLLALGFQYNACHEVVQLGITDINLAVERLLHDGNDNCSDNQAKVISGQTNSNSTTDVRTVKSRLDPSDDNQRNLRERFYEKERHQVQFEYKKQRLEDKQAKMKILNEIAKDKSEKSLHNDKTCSTSLSTSNKTHDNKFPVPIHNDNQCSILIRLPAGESKKMSFAKESTLEQVLNSLILEKSLDTGEQFSILQTFPKKAFTEHEMKKSLLELNFFPSSTLTIVKKLAVENLQVLPEVTPKTPRASYNECGETMDQDMNNSDVEVHTVSPSNVEDEDEPSSTIVDRSRNNLFEKAMLKRMEAEIVTPKIQQLHRGIPSLQLLAAISVAIELSKFNPLIVNSMYKMQINSAINLVITALKDKKLLNPKVLQLLLPCRLQELKLDFYILCTNDLIGRLRWYTTLRKLSLISAVCITDKAIELALKGLNLLEYLNLTDCQKLTPHILLSITDLPNLKVLILDKVKISNTYLHDYLLNKTSDHLLQLSLNYCAIDEDAFQDIPTIYSLVHLFLNHTKIARCNFLSRFPNLTSLHLRNTLVTDDQMNYIGCRDQLKTLELHGTPVTNDGLQHFRDLSLTRLVLPSKLVVNTDSIRIIKGLPLSILDLSDHRNVDDNTLLYISAMDSLVNLSLSNTKITDISFHLLSALKSIEILDVSRCNLTNAISTTLKDLPSLHTLNLSSTKIDDQIVPIISRCQNMYKLNLSRTSLTNKSCTHFRLPYLHTLLLDQTEVTWDGVQEILENAIQCNLNQREQPDGEDEETEELDPRVEIELEKLNTASNDINILEKELDEARSLFRQRLSDAARKMKSLGKVIGNHIDNARPYFEAVSQAKKAQLECQNAALVFGRACQLHKEARETISVAEDKLMKNPGMFDASWQEMLNNATLKVMEAEKEKLLSESSHHEAAMVYRQLEERVALLEKQLRKSINKARPYFQERSQYLGSLEAQKVRVQTLETKYDAAKRQYSTSLRNLEIISEAIHKKRNDCRPMTEAPTHPREECIGAETSLQRKLSLSKSKLRRQSDECIKQALARKNFTSGRFRSSLLLDLDVDFDIEDSLDCGQPCKSPSSKSVDIGCIKMNYYNDYQVLDVGPFLERERRLSAKLLSDKIRKNSSSPSVGSFCSVDEPIFNDETCGSIEETWVTGVSDLIVNDVVSGDEIFYESPSSTPLKTKQVLVEQCLNNTQSNDLEKRFNKEMNLNSLVARDTEESVFSEELSTDCDSELTLCNEDINRLNIERTSHEQSDDNPEESRQLSEKVNLECTETDVDDNRSENSHCNTQCENIDICEDKQSKDIHVYEMPSLCEKTEADKNIECTIHSDDGC